MEGRQQPFGLSTVEGLGRKPMDASAEASSEPASRASAPEQRRLLDLEEALSLATAYFEGNPAVVAWANSSEDEPASAQGATDDATAGGLDEAFARWGLEDDWLLQDGNAAAAPDTDAGLDLGGLDALGDPGASKLPGEEAPDISLANSASSADKRPATQFASLPTDALEGQATQPEDSRLDDIDVDGKEATAPESGPLSLEAALATGPEAPDPPAPVIVPAPTDVAAAERDPIAALEAAIQADKPEFKPSPEWLRMMESVHEELEEAAGAGQPELVDEPASSSSAARTPTVTPREPLPKQSELEAEGPAEADMDGSEGAEEPAQAGQTDAGGEHLREHSVDTLEDDSRHTFAALQPICSLLLVQRTDPQRTVELLQGLESVLQAATSAGLQQCQDYVMFPLLLMLDAIAANRQNTQNGQQQGAAAALSGEAAALMALPAMSSDRAAEAALACLLQVVRRCIFQTSDSLLSILRRLASVLEISRDAVSEEIRLQALLCLGAVAEGVAHRRPPPGVQESLLEASSAPLVGYLSSLALRIAEAEAECGSGGSKAVHDAALENLLHLLRAVSGATGAAAEPAQPAAGQVQRAADALAFFLPGIAVGLCKVLLHAGSGSGSSRSSAAGPSSSSAGASAALRALVTLLTACLGNAAVAPALHGADTVGAADSPPAAGGQDSHMPDAAVGGNAASLQQALEQLHMLSQQAKDPGKAGSSSSEPPASTSMPASRQQEPQQGQMRVQRSTEWVHDTASRLDELLRTALPPLAAHQRPSVRRTLAVGCCQLLDNCSMALEMRTQEMLLQLLLSAAQDGWSDVAAPACLWLQQQASCKAPSASWAPSEASRGPSGTFASATESLTLQLIEGLPGALRSGDAPGRQHALQLASALQVCAPSWFASQVIHHPLRLQQLLSNFADVFAFDASMAGMLLHSAAPPHGAATSYAPGSQTGTAAAHSASTATPVGATASESVQVQQMQQQQNGLHSADGGSEGSVVLLPRMPMGLVLVTTAASYEAVVTALRSAAALAVAADGAQASNGIALRSLLDGCLARLRELLATSVDRQALAGGGPAAAVGVGQAADPAAAGQEPWQLQAASLAVVLAELVLGASPAWQPKWSSQQGSSSDGSWSGGSTELEALSAVALQELLQPAVWSLPTGEDAAANDGASAGADQPPLLQASPAPNRRSMQQLGCNALLLKSAIECCGVVARALGPRFSQNGRLVRTTLLPLLEKLADGAQVVSSSAAAALGSICWWCGYAGSLKQLITANADYVVDGCCAQLRQLEAHPQAPQLFTALLQQAGVAPQLLPLLAEPAVNAVQGLGILARRQQPQHVLAFLQVLLPVAHAAGSVAKPALDEMRHMASQVELRWEEHRRQREAEEAAALGAADAASLEDIKRYFERRQRLKQEQQGLEDMQTDEEQAPLVRLSSYEREQVALLRRHVHAAGTLAEAIANAASPLAMSASLQVAVQSLGVCTAALTTLAAVTEAVDLDEHKIQALVHKQSTIAAPNPVTPRMLPGVHLAWAPLVSALQDWRIPVVEVALKFLADCVCLSGSFLRKRFHDETMPVVQRLLKDGPTQRNIIAPGQDVNHTPATVQRAQHAVLRCLHTIATCNTPLAIAGVNGRASDALVPSVQALLIAVGDLMGSNKPASVREKATEVYIALSRIDPDAAWCQLHAAVVSSAPVEDTMGMSDTPDAFTQVPLKSEDRTLVFPKWQDLAPQMACAQRSQAASEYADTLWKTVIAPGLRERAPTSLRSMQQQVAQMDAPWHERVSNPFSTEG